MMQGAAEIVVDMDEASDYIEEEDVEIVLDPEYIIDPGPEARRPLIVRFPAPDAHLRACISRFTGDHAHAHLIKPNRAPQNLRVPYYTRDMDQALLYAHRLFETMCTRPPFDTLEWNPRVPKLYVVRSIAAMLPDQFQRPINTLIVAFSRGWHRSDLGMALAIVFKQPLDTVMRRIDAVMAHVAANPPSAAVTADVVEAARGRPRKYVEDGEVIVID